MTDNRSVLIVDDDDAILQLFELVGSKFNIQTVVAQNGSEALSKFEKQNFRLVITDLRMPKMTGDEFIKRVRQSPKHKTFPFIVITANLKEFDSKIALLDRVHVLEKPIKLGSIQKIYATIFGQKESLPKDGLSHVLEDAKDKIAILLEVFTKEKPEIITSKINLSENADHAHFCICHPVFEKEKTHMLLYFFEPPLASKITSTLNPLYKGEIGQTQLILESLKKMSVSLSKKIQEGLDKDHPATKASSLIVITGTDEASTKILISKEGEQECVKLKTKHGVLTLVALCDETKNEDQ